MSTQADSGTLLAQAQAVLERLLAEAEEDEAEQTEGNPMLSVVDQAPSAGVTTTLRELSRRVRRMLGDAACGPLQAAFDVAEVRDRWEELHAVDADAAGFTSFDSWARARLGYDAAWWGRRVAAAHRLLRVSGPSKSRVPLDSWHHEAAVWACHQPAIGDDMLREIHEWVIGQALDGGGHPPSARRVEIHAQRLMGRQRKPTVACARCSKLAAVAAENPALAELLREHGIEV